MWIYLQRPGWWIYNQFHLATGYSGHEEGRNNPALQSAPNKGPIPQGAWLIGEPYDSPLRGKYCLPLLPLHGTEVFGRGGFLIHGDSIEHHGEGVASHGCIILPRPMREQIGKSRDRLLVVLSGDAFENVANILTLA